LGFLECVDVFRDAFRRGIVSHHLRVEVDEFAWVEASAVGVEVLQELSCRDLVVLREKFNQSSIF
jgi:hypothetical protein